MSRLVLVFASLLFLTGCVSIKKQRDRAYNYFRDNPHELAEMCADKFPPKVEYRPGKTDTLISTDTLIIKGDSIPCPEVVDKETGETYKPYVKCPDVEQITKRYLRVDSLLQVSTAREEQYRLNAERLKIDFAVKDEQLKSETARANKYRNYLFTLGGLVALIGIFRGKRLFL